MKKTIITALVVLFVMLMFATCDNIITEPGAEKPEYTYTADGRKLMTLKVNTGGTAGSRGINQTIAETADWVEVIFEASDGKFYKTEGANGLTLTITLPVETYDVDKAVALIGKKITIPASTPTDPDTYEYTLLAIGYLSEQAKLAEVSKVTFSVAPLEVNLSAAANTLGTTIAANVYKSSFKIIDTWIIGTELFKDINPSTGSNVDNTIKGKFLGDNSPCFLLPTDRTKTEVSLTIGGLDDTSSLISVDKDADLDDGVVIFNYFPKTTSKASELKATNIVIDRTNGLDLNFDLETTDAGKYVITFEIPVFGLSDTEETNSDQANFKAGYKKTLPWIISGGTQTNPDFSPSATPTDIRPGDGVALIVTPTVAGYTTITVGK